MEGLSELLMTQISIVIPLYNESSLISELINRVKQNVELVNLDYEIILIDDNSTEKYDFSIIEGINLIVNNENLGFLPFSFNNLELENFPDYKLSIPKIYRLTYDESVPVTLQFNPVNGNKKFIDLKIDGVFCPSFTDYTDDEQSYFVNYFYAKKNQTILITYKIENVSTGVIDTNSQEITIGTDAIQTTINY